MSAPSVQGNKFSANAVQAAQTGLGILAIIAPCVGSASLPFNVSIPFSDTGLLQAAGVEGPLVEYGTYDIIQTEQSILAVRANASTPGFATNPAIPPITIVSVTNGPPAVLSSGVVPHMLATGDVVTIAGGTGDTVINGTFEATVVDTFHFSIPVTGTGTYAASSATATFGGIDYVGTGTAGPGITVNAAAASDDYQMMLVATAPGTTGTAGIVWNPSFDFGASFGSPIAQGTSLTVSPTLPTTGAPSGVTFTFTTAQTVAVGDIVTSAITGVRSTVADVQAALAGLRASQFEWDLVLIHGDTSPAFVAAADAWSTSLAPLGMFPYLLLNTRHEYIPRPSAESDSAYQVAMASLLSNSSSINLTVGASAADMVSPITGVTKPMPASLYIAARCEDNEIGVDPAETDLGPLPNANLYFANGAPKWHDEFIEGGLDTPQIRLSTLRTWSDEQGTFVTNAYTLSSQGSNFVYIQQARVLNAALQAAWSQMKSLTSKGYPVNLKTGLIQPAKALEWQARGQDVVNEVVAGQVSGVKFIVSQQDINLGNGPALITCSLKCAPLKYVKKFVINSYFVNTLS